MHMANLPAKREPDSLPQLSKAQRKALTLLGDGHSLGSAARELAKKNGHTEKAWRQLLRRWAATDEVFQRAIALEAHGQLGVDLVRVVKAVGNRAARGNPNMARLAMEASGFHNPKVDHKHSGEVKITLSGIPRPTAGQEDPPTITEAEVVEE